VTRYKKFPDHISNSLTFPGLQNSLTILEVFQVCGNPDLPNPQLLRAKLCNLIWSKTASLVQTANEIQQGEQLEEPEQCADSLS